MHRAGDVGNLALVFADLAVLFDRLEQPATAATLYGASTRGDIGWVLDLPAVVDHLRDVLGEADLEACVATGAAMDLSDATQYAQRQIRPAQRQLQEPTSLLAPRG